MGRRNIIIVSLALLTLAACAGRDVFNPLAANTTYFCDQGRQMVISLGDRGERAAVAFEGRNLTLERTGSESFSNSIYTLYINEDDGAVMEKDGVPVFSDCKP